MFTTTLQFTKFQNINGRGEVVSKTMYGYRIYNTDTVAYVNSYDSVEELEEEVNVDTIVDHIRENHPEFVDTIIEDGGFYLNHIAIDRDGEVIDDDDYDDDEDEDDETLLPDESELPNGEPKYELNIDPDEIDEVEKIIEEASKNLI